jgi:hypothetical protein
VEHAALLALLQTRVWGLKAVPAGYGIGSEGRTTAAHLTIGSSPDESQATRAASFLQAHDRRCVIVYLLGFDSETSINGFPARLSREVVNDAAHEAATLAYILR